MYQRVLSKIDPLETFTNMFYNYIDIRRGSIMMAPRGHSSIRFRTLPFFKILLYYFFQNTEALPHNNSKH